jgi:hypothetical protein
MSASRLSTEEEQRFIGGMRVSLAGRTLEGWSWDMDCANASHPRAELIVDETSIRVRLRFRWMRRVLGRLCPAVEIALEGSRARPSGRTTMTRAVILNGIAGGDHRSVIFWCTKRTQRRLLDLLKQRGVATG